MRRLRAGIARLVAYALPAYVVMAFTLVVHGFVAPWPAAQPLLARHAGQVAVQVGIASGARRSPARGMESVKTHYYVLVPEVLHEPRLVRITRRHDDPPVESTTRSGFFLLAAAFAAALVGTWWIWVRPVLLTRPPSTRGR